MSGRNIGEAVNAGSHVKDMNAIFKHNLPGKTGCVHHTGLYGRAMEDDNNALIR